MRTKTTSMDYAEWKWMPRKINPRDTHYPDLVRMFKSEEGYTLMKLLKEKNMIFKFRTEPMIPNDSMFWGEDIRYFRMWMVDPDNLLSVDKVIQTWIKVKRRIKGEADD